MNEVTTNQPDTMRQLLARWAAVEPEWCKNQNHHSFTRDEEDDNFYIKDGGGDTWGWHLVISDSNPSDEEGYYPYKRNALMYIQAAVQDAIIERGWSIELNYNPGCSDPNNPYDAVVETSTSGDGWGFGNDGFTAPLLSAYLQALEANQ